MSVYQEDENEIEEDDITIVSISNEAVAGTILHLKCDACFISSDDLNPHEVLPALVSPDPPTDATRMIDLQDAVVHQPFPFPDSEYLVPPTGPIFLPYADPRGEACYSWSMTRCPICPVDVTRTGSPTNIADESVFLESSESETNDDDLETEDLSPTVLPYAYASPEVYNTSREPQSYDFDSSDDDMRFGYDPSSPESDDDTLGSYYTDVGVEVALLKASGDTPATPIDLTQQAEAVIDPTSSRDEDMPSAAQMDHAAAGQSFSDTSDDTRPEEVSQRPPVARVLDIPDDEVVVPEDELDEWEWDINEDQAFLSHGLPDACVFTGQALAFGQPPLIQDAAQRSFNHLYLEEEIARNQWRIMTEDHDHLGSINSFDPINIHVMTSLNPEYVSNVQDVINGGTDEDFRGIFTYVSEEEDDGEAPDAAIIRNLPPPDHEHGIMVSMADLRLCPNYWVCDTSTSGPSCVHDKGLIKIRDFISDEMHGNNGSTLPIVKCFDTAGTVFDKHNKPDSSIVLRGVNHVPSSTFNLFSVAQSLKTRWKFYGNFQGFVLTKGDARIIFDIRIPSGSGCLWATTIVPCKTAGINPEVTNFSGVVEKLILIF